MDKKLSMPRVLAIILLFINASVFSQAYRTITNTAFVRGEKLAFRVAYNSSITGSIPAGKATLEVKDESKIIITGIRIMWLLRAKQAV